MAEHTKGRLEYRKIHDGRYAIGEWCEVWITPNDNPEANARRLVAAWNACEAITTEALEAGCVARWVNELCGTDEEKEETPLPGMTP